MLQFLFDAIDLWTDAPRKLKAWLGAAAVAAAVVGGSLLLDRCAAAKSRGAGPLAAAQAGVSLSPSRVSMPRATFSRV